ncbi:MAG TPA: HNH endonuclease signature motif containing protein, partial [Ilumatobacteraceae bacterium]|nr:HNH endonuclease signature motif containing protein [Ilumatobacteraceae bacterium]
MFVVRVGDGAFGHLCELANGVPIGPGELVPYLSEAMVQSVLFDGPITLLGVSKQRSFTGALRTAIAARDRHCQHPSGCDTPADLCDVDHIIPWSQGGPTAAWNGRMEC